MEKRKTNLWVLKTFDARRSGWESKSCNLTQDLNLHIATIKAETVGYARIKISITGLIALTLDSSTVRIWPDLNTLSTQASRGTFRPSTTQGRAAGRRRRVATAAGCRTGRSWWGVATTTECRGRLWSRLASKGSRCCYGCLSPASLLCRGRGARVRCWPALTRTFAKRNCYCFSNLFGDWLRH